MSVRSTLIALALVTVSLAGCAQDTGPGTTVTVTQDFEKGIRNWDLLVAAPEGADATSMDVNATVESGRALQGDFALNLTIDAPGPNGTIGIQRPLEVERGQPYTANVTIDARSTERSSVPADLLVHLGPNPAIGPDSYPALGENTSLDRSQERGGLRANLTDDWTTHAFAWTVPARDNATLHASIAILGEEPGRAEALVDDLEIVFTRVPTMAPTNPAESPR